MSEKARIIAVEECSVAPVLVKFQNNMSCPEDFHVRIATDKSHKSNPPLVIAASSDSIYSGLVEDNPLVNNFLVIRNKRTNTARLVPYTSCSLISEHYTTVPLVIPNTEKDQQALKYSLAKYGGKNAMRAHDRINRMKMNIDVIKDQLDQTISMSSEQMKLEHMEEERLLDGQDEGVEPAKNYEAKTIHELYNFRDILSHELFEELEEIAVQVLETKPDDLPLSSDFLMNKFRGVQSNSTMPDSDKSQAVKAIIFADALRTLIQESSKKGRRQILQRLSLSQICEGVEVYIRRNFMDPKSVNGALTRFTRRKAICHFLIIAILLTSKCEVSTDEMILELKLRKEELLDFARFLNLRTALNSSFMGLRLPKNKKDDDSRKIRRVKIEKKK